MRRKAAGTLRVRAPGRAAHSGSAPDQGRNALLGLAGTALELSRHHDPAGPQHLSVVPTVMRSGDAFNVVPAAGRIAVRHARRPSSTPSTRVLSAVPADVNGVTLEAAMERRWPGMDSTETTRALLERASERLGRPIIGAARGGASDASHFAATVP